VGNTDDIPIEIIELKYPLRYHRSELIANSGGPGRFRGGLGTMREVEVLSDGARASIQADRTVTKPWGTVRRRRRQEHALLGRRAGTARSRSSAAAGPTGRT